MSKPRTRLKEKRLVGVAALAEYIDSTPGSVRVQMSNRTLPFPSIKFGRKVLFDLEDVDRWIETLPRYGAIDAEKGNVGRKAV